MTMTRDERGISNHRSGGQLQYEYDYAERLVAVNDLSGGLTTPVASFAYDALGRRVSKRRTSRAFRRLLRRGDDVCDGGAGAVWRRMGTGVGPRVSS